MTAKAATCQCTCGRRGCASRRKSLKSEAHVQQQSSTKTRRRNDESQEWAENKGKEWTGPELETVARGDLTEREAARILKRTRQAVAYQRRLIRAADPTRVWLTGASRTDSTSGVTP